MKSVGTKKRSIGTKIFDLQDGVGKGVEAETFSCVENFSGVLSSEFCLYVFLNHYILSKTT